LPIFALEKVSGFDEASNHNRIFLLVAGVSILTILYWPWAYVIRRNYQRKQSGTLALPWSGKMIAWINYFFLFVFLIGLALSLSDPFEIVYGVPASLKVLLILPFFVILTTVAMCIFFFRSFANNRYSVMSRFYYAILCVVSLLALWQLNYWNLIGFNY
jgi:hypothetical protein